MTAKSNIRTFAPERWPEWEKFEKLYRGTHIGFSPQDKKAVRGAGSHYSKAIRLVSLAAKLTHNLITDSDELEQKGYTSAANAKEFAAVLEAAILEFYSAVDCTRAVLVAALPTIKGLSAESRKSTRRFLKWALDGKMGDDFPSSLRTVFIDASWYDELRTLRDELTHGTLGSCHRDSRSEKVSYIHGGVRHHGMPLHVPDITDWLGELIGGVGRLMEGVFRYLNACLGSTLVEVECGFFHGHYFSRMLAAEVTININSGICHSRIMFDKEPTYRCPYADECGAYARAGENTPPSEAEPA